MDVFEAVAKRHSYRGTFQPEAPSRQTLTRIVEAGLLAPSGKNEQTTTFVIVDDPELVGKIKAMPGGNKAVCDARAYIACVLDREPEAIYEGHSFQIEDCAAAVQTMLLAVTALGLATVWIDGWLRVENRAAIIGEMLRIPSEKVIRVLLPLGVPTRLDPPRPPKMLFEERAWFNTHG